MTERYLRTRNQHPICFDGIHSQIRFTIKCTAHIISCSRKIAYLRVTKEGSFIFILEAFKRDTLLASVVQRVYSVIH